MPALLLAIQSGRGPSFAEILSGAAIVAAIALLAWMASSIHAVLRKVDRIDVALFGEHGRGGYEARFERLEGELEAETTRRHKLANRVHAHAGRLALIEQRMGMYSAPEHTAEDDR